MIEYAELNGQIIHDLLSDNPTQAEEIVGLSGIPGIRGSTYERPESDGDVEPDNMYMPARISVWNYKVFGTNAADAETNWVTLNRILLQALRSQQLLKWRTLGGLELQALVRLAGTIPPDFKTGGPPYSAQISLRAADPRNYGQNLLAQTTDAPGVLVTGIPFPVPWPVPWSLTASGSGTITVTNDGDAEAWPTIDIRGPIQNPVITNISSGQALYFDDLTIASGALLSITMSDAFRTATVDGVNAFSSIRFSDSEFFSIAAGATELISFAGTGTDANTQMTVYMRSAYVS